MSAANLVEELASRGQYCFTTDEAVAALGSSVVANAKLDRLRLRLLESPNCKKYADLARDGLKVVTA